MAGMTAGYALMAPGEMHIPVYRALGVNLRVLGQQMIVPARTVDKFIARAAWLRIVSIAGTLSVAPIVRIGNNGTFNNLFTVLTLTGAALDRVFTLPLSATLLATAVTTPISVDVSTIATGVTALTADVFVQGHFV